MTVLDICLKQGFRLNRLLCAASLFFICLQAQFWLFGHNKTGWALGALVISSFVLSVLFFLVNEIGFRTFKSIHRNDTLAQGNLGMGLPLFTTAYLTLMYLLGGQAGNLLLMVFGVFLAQTMGHRRLSTSIALGGGVIFLVSLALGYPKVFPIVGLGQIPGSEWVAQIVPFLILLCYLYQTTTSTLFSTQDKVVKLQSLAATDALTGLINRRQFNHQLHSEIARARRHKTPLSLALFDIDDFKKINDVYGHPVGDRILKELGTLIMQNVRESDTPARYGGEEFALILPETRQTEAYELLERLRALIERTVFCLPDNPMTSTISVGVAQMDFKDSSAFELVETADTALYEAKKQGKNRVVYGVVTTPKLQITGKAASFKLNETHL